MEIKEVIENILDKYQDPNILNEYTCNHRVYFRTKIPNEYSFEYENCVKDIGGVKILQKEILQRKGKKVSLKQIRRLKGRYRKKYFDFLEAGKWPHNSKYWTSINVIDILDTIIEMLEEKEIKTITKDNLISKLRRKINSNNVTGCSRMEIIKKEILTSLS